MRPTAGACESTGQLLRPKERGWFSVHGCVSYPMFEYSFLIMIIM